METWKYKVLTDLSQVEGTEKWKNIQTLVRVIPQRIFSNKTTTENRYYISSINLSADKFNECIRAHWGVENNVH